MRKHTQEEQTKMAAIIVRRIAKNGDLSTANTITIQKDEEC